MVVAAVTFICIAASKSELNRTAYAQKEEVMIENTTNDEHSSSYDESEAEVKDLSQNAPYTEDPELSKLMSRLERAGVSYGFQEAVQNNMASDEVIAELNQLMDELDAASEGSEEKNKLLKLISEYEIPGITESVGEEIEKAHAQQIAKDAMTNMFHIDIGKSADALETQYMGAGIYAKNDSLACWDIEDSTDEVWYYFTIDAISGRIISANWVSKGKSEGAGEVDVTITQSQLDSYLSAAQSFVSAHLLKDNLQITNCVLGEGSKEGESYTVVGPTVVTDVVLNDGTVVHNLVNIKTTDIVGFYMSKIWDK